ncbi:MAG: lipoate-protein ligase B, partial [Corynebacterium sp.]|nr:lipoate-protein ligase B [Corynebacterium sp.]
YIIPCGISDAGVTTLSRELDRDVSVSEMTESLLADLQDALEGRLTVADHSFGSAPDPTKDLPHRVKHNSTTGIFEYSSTKE